MANIIHNMDRFSITFLLVLTCALVVESQQQPQQQPQPRLRHQRPGISRARPPQPRTNPRLHPCEQSSCYPATGNLLIGRENRLSASSTCGSSGPERFCIVSHLEEKKCFLCETNEYTEHNSQLNHRVGQIIYKFRPGTLENTWWQSENGKENVSIQLNLEAEFHFTHLIIVFATFRPAAMLIERSYDFGETWHVYRYFASNCAESFPHALVEAESRNITDVVCDHRYSSVEPSKNGEVIFRVLPPSLNIDNPYADHVQNMLKMTNLRINFTRLHTLGDTLLDDRSEIQEKYYYGISNMVVRGSCSCYGHASRCLPLDGFETQNDMVHGRCECTHNTKGLNCEFCEDFYNDLPWKPALGKQTNACKKCHCNNHATRCHFDQTAYDLSGKVSGGVCDDCQHHTQGQHCESCKLFFYRDPNEDIQSPYACKPCECDPLGSSDEGMCDSNVNSENTEEEAVAGACHCKNNVKGRRCDICKEGFWNLTQSNTDGCEECTCNTLGTVNNLGCNVYTGECTCKALVTGKDCNQCMPETYGLSESRDGCSPCACDAGGSLDNNCDVITGQCKCRPYMQGRDCSEPKQNHFIPKPHLIIEAEGSNTVCESDSLYSNCSVVLRDPYPDRVQWTGPGFLRVFEGGDVSFTVDNVPKTMNYDVQIRYSPQIRGDWDDVRITVVRPDAVGQDTECANANLLEEQERALQMNQYETSVVALQDLCLEEGKTYKFIVSFHRQSYYEPNPKAQILIDSLALIPRIDVSTVFTGSANALTRKQEFDHYRCNDTYYDITPGAYMEKCQELIRMISTEIFNGATPCECDLTGSYSKKCDEYGGFCRCKPNVVGRQCDQCAPGNYGFSPNGCQSCDCDSIGAKDNDCHQTTGQCNCQPNTYGRECNQCQIGYWNFPDCQPCNCNGHAIACDSKTGECINCQDSTTGYNCDRCIENYYGDPLLGSEIGCRPCRCPDTVASGHSFATECALISSSNDVVCYCQPGYAGNKCDICDDNYFGNPSQPGGECKSCNCSNNIDTSRSGNCDARTGNCLQCLYDTAGDACEYCRDGYYGSAEFQDCRPCDCDVLGSLTGKYCDRYTGQCECLPHVVGARCDQCESNHWKIASGEGCEPCKCDPVGAYADQCNPYDGQCECRPGFGGRACNQCEANFWGDPNEQCKPCDCSRYGSSTYQCNQQSGQCQCITGIGGYKCDECARGYLGDAPYCSPCGECFDNWDIILGELKTETESVIVRAKQIKTQGATGAYTKEFEDIEKKLDVIRNILNSTDVSTRDIKKINSKIDALRKKLEESEKHLGGTDSVLDKLTEEMNLAAIELQNLDEKSDKIKKMAESLKENATQLQEANIEGALNLTRDAYNRVQDLSINYAEIADINSEIDRQCKRIENYVSRKADNDENASSNDKQLNELQEELDQLKALIPELNEQICDRKEKNEETLCDALCGGAGCNKCGGISCEKGALTRAETALKYAKDTEEIIKKKEQQAEELIRSVAHSKTEAMEAHKKAKEVFNKIEQTFNSTEALLNQGRALITNLTDVLANETASPSEIKEIADNIMKLDLHLEPEEIKHLANNIDKTVADLENVEAILENTRHDLEMVENLRKNAEDASKRANAVLKRATEVSNALNEAEQAQNAARDAIKKANDDITTTKSDLDEIDTEAKQAKEKIDDTAASVENLQARLMKLQRKFTKNVHDTKEIKNRVESAKEISEDAHKKAQNLKGLYTSANKTLTGKASSSEIARERAQKLLNRASKITVDTNAKLKELQDMVTVTQSNDGELSLMEQKIHRLNGEIDSYIQKLREKQAYYRSCTS